VVSSIAAVRVRGIHHLGIAVPNLDEAIATYQLLFGARLEGRDSLGEQGVDAASLMVGESRVELVAPTGEDSHVGRFLASRGPGMHHVALETDDVHGALQELAAAGVQLVDEVPRRGLFGLEVAFVHPSSVHGVLTEVVSSG
jgi:methylmalonyl-CoA/ethylmalonyl-CoA epimerase